MRWFYGDPRPQRAGTTRRSRARSSTRSCWPCICVAIATPLGVTLALGLQRWRGRGSGTVNVLMLLPLVTPEIVMGVALLLLFLQIFNQIGLGTTAQAIGQITFTLSYVVVMVRGRLVSIGPEYEEAAADLGAPPHDVLFRVLLPLLAPAILASAAVVFALSIDDFVVTQYLSGDAEHDDRVDAAVRIGPRRADAGAERTRDDRAVHHTGDAHARVLRLPALRRAAKTPPRSPPWRCSRCRAKSGSSRSSSRSATSSPWTASTSTCHPASSSRWSGRPAAARRRRCA